MKTILNIAVLSTLVIALSGCVSAREEQNPQPRTYVPCKEWAAVTKVEGTKSDTNSPSKPAEKKQVNSQTKKSNKKVSPKKLFNGKKLSF